MLNKKLLEAMKAGGRSLAKAESGDEDIGAFKLLPGTWRNKPGLVGAGWNMIALPFIDKGGENGVDYRLLVNHYNEEFRFTTIDKAVPNRGIEPEGGEVVNSDQFVVTLDYQQHIKQIKADDFPQSGLAGGPNLDIHHEPGLFLQMANHVTEDLEIARLASVPHGNTVLALGEVRIYDGPPSIPNENGLPVGVAHDLESRYLAPYKHFHEQPFEGMFDPTRPNELLHRINEGVDIVRTTEFHFNTEFGSGGINNIPFIKRQADASRMWSTFWVQELAEKDEKGNPKLRLQYTQTVMLDFFKREDGKPGRMQWPHVSINTMEKVPEGE